MHQTLPDEEVQERERQKRKSDQDGSEDLHTPRSAGTSDSPNLPGDIADGSPLPQQKRARHSLHLEVPSMHSPGRPSTHSRRSSASASPRWNRGRPGSHASSRAGTPLTPSFRTTALHGDEVDGLRLSGMSQVDGGFIFRESSPGISEAVSWEPGTCPTPAAVDSDEETMDPTFSMSTLRNLDETDIRSGGMRQEAVNAIADSSSRLIDLYRELGEAHEKTRDLVEVNLQELERVRDELRDHRDTQEKMEYEDEQWGDEAA